MPIRFCRWLGKIVARAVYVFSTKDRMGLAFNISLAMDMPLDHPFVRRTVRRVFENYGQYMVDFFLMPQLPPYKARKFFAQLRGQEILHDALMKGRGAILLTAHVGNWEFGGAMMRLAHYPLAVVVKAHNTHSTNALVNKLRKRRGMDVIEVGQSPFSTLKILGHLRKNGIVAMTGDKVFSDRGEPVNFFGRQASFPIGPVLMAMKSEASLIPTFVLKQPDGRYQAVLERPIPLVLDGRRAEIIRKNLEKTARIFEQYIRLYPDQWYCPDPITGGTIS